MLVEFVVLVLILPTLILDPKIFTILPCARIVSVDFIENEPTLSLSESAVNVIDPAPRPPAKVSIFPVKVPMVILLVASISTFVVFAKLSKNA